MRYYETAPVNFSTFLSRPSGGGMISGARTIDDAYFKAIEHAFFLFSNDPQRTAATIEVYSSCPKCLGNGRYLKARSKWTYLECKTCKGSGQGEQFKHETILRGES